MLEFIRQCPWSDKRHGLLLAWMVEAGCVNLTHSISSVETGAEYAQSTQRRFSRWMHNPRIHPTYLYRPLIKWALSQWSETTPTTLETFWEYGLRFDIEENFLDDKSNGFNWESSGLRDTTALSRLCLVLAVTTLFLTLQGKTVVEAGLRRRVDTHFYRDMSYLKIGWEWLKSFAKKGWFLFPLLSSNLQS